MSIIESFKEISATDITFFTDLFGERCKTIHSDIKKYSSDETEDLVYMPSVVVLPEKTEEIAKVLKYCNTHKIPVTPAGARTGLSGGALPICGGVLLST